MMDLSEIAGILQNKFGIGAIELTESSGLQPGLVISPPLIDKVCLELRDNPKTYFDFLSCLSAVDHGLTDKRFSVVYHLASIPFNLRLTLKVFKEFDREVDTMPVFKSVSHIWRTAEWHEREAYDLLGVYFEGHPDLRRILLPDDWEGFPLRKDYKTAENYKGIKIDY